MLETTELEKSILPKLHTLVLWREKEVERKIGRENKCEWIGK